MVVGLIENQMSAAVGDTHHSYAENLVNMNEVIAEEVDIDRTDEWIALATEAGDKESLLQVIHEYNCANFNRKSAAK